MFYPKSKFVLGAAVGVAAAATGYYLYKKNQDKVDSFLRDQGLNIPASKGASYDEMNLEELVLTKEQIEDIIAEKEAAKA